MLMPYLHYQGDCEQAFQLYAGAFGGKIDFLSRYTEQTGGPALAGKVMHASVTLGDKGSLNGADYAEPTAHGNAIQLIVHFDTAQEGQAVMEALAQGGTLIQGFTPHPPPDESGVGALVLDKFGFTWILSAPNPDKG